MTSFEYKMLESIKKRNQEATQKTLREWYEIFLKEGKVVQGDRVFVFDEQGRLCLLMED
jgi:hypothetical protein